MDIQARASLGAMSATMHQQGLAAQLISKTLSGLNGTAEVAGMANAANNAMQKSVVAAAYAANGIGTKVNTIV